MRLMWLWWRYAQILLSSYVLSGMCVSPLFATLHMELTHGSLGAIPISIMPFTVADATPNVAEIVAQDLQHSGRFRVVNAHVSVAPQHASQLPLHYFQRHGINNVVLWSGQIVRPGVYRIQFQLLDVFHSDGQQAILMAKSFIAPASDLRRIAHRISDLIYENILNIKGVFSTKLAYVVKQVDKQGISHYQLEIADQDGAQPFVLLHSPYPIMSPTWSPDGKELAYVSFEQRHAAIYMQTIATGQRYLLSDFPGINGAPAWSPNGKQLALVLSKSGSPNIYLLTIATHQLTPITQDWYINTEPAWSRDGKMLFFTSNRSGGPQIYAIHLTDKDKHPVRLSYDGDYNARPVVSANGQWLAMIHREQGIYRIATMNLTNGMVQVVSPAQPQDSSSPSLAPNNSMILYDTVVDQRSILAMTSIEGNVQIHLPARSGDVEDPAWSPFLS